MKRLTDFFRVFVATVVGLGAAVAHEVADAVEESFSPPSAKQAAYERELKGQVFTIQPVDRAALERAVGAIVSPAGYLADVRELCRAIQNEVDVRGPAWSDQCLRGALIEHLVKPLRSTAADVVKDAQAAKPAKGKKAA